MTDQGGWSQRTRKKGARVIRSRVSDAPVPRQRTRGEDNRFERAGLSRRLTEFVSVKVGSGMAEQSSGQKCSDQRSSGHCWTHVRNLGNICRPVVKKRMSILVENLFLISFFSPLRAASFHNFCWRVSLILHELCAMRFTHCNRITYLGCAAAGKEAYDVRLIWNTLDIRFFAAGRNIDGAR